MSLSLKSPIGSAVAGALLSSFMAMNTAQAEPPPVGSEQWNMLAPHKDFIVKMRKPNGGTNCCDLADGRGDLKERYVDGKLQVFITRELYPNASSAAPRLGNTFNLNNLPLVGEVLGGITLFPDNLQTQSTMPTKPGIPEEGMWIDVPEADILSPKHAFELCKEMRKIEGNTCTLPPFNVLWLNVYTLQPYCYIRRDMGI